MKPRAALVAFALTSVLLTAGCGEGSVDGAGQSAGRIGASPSAEASAAPQDTSLREVRRRSPNAAAGDSAVRLRGVEVTRHGAFDRVRFTFSGPVSKVFAEYRDALRAPGRGERIPLAGEHQLVLVFVGMARQSPVVEAGSTAAVREVRATAVFEGELTAGIGTHTEGEGPGGFRVRPDGNTVTVDVAHQASAAAGEH